MDVPFPCICSSSCMQLTLQPCSRIPSPCHRGTQMRSSPSQVNANHNSYLSLPSPISVVTLHHLTCSCLLCYSVEHVPWEKAVSKYVNTKGSWRAVKYTNYSKQTRKKDYFCKAFWLPWFQVVLIVTVAIIYVYLHYLLIFYSSPHMHLLCTLSPVLHWCCTKPLPPQELQGKRRQGPQGWAGHQSLGWADCLGGTQKLLSSSETILEEQWPGQEPVVVRVLWEGKTQASDMVTCTCVAEKKLWKSFSHQSPMASDKRLSITVGMS